MFALACAPDGSRLASGADDGTVRIGMAALRGHTDHVMCLAWSPDGQRLHSGSGDRTIRAWGAR